jgi:L-ascorbate metabolism protein UlaG (beta-lactamase superfamily)
MAIQVKIWYLGHSGWAIKTSHHFLIFDYSGNFKKKSEKTLTNGYINPEEISDENVYVFVSHNHYDHHDSVIHEWSENIKNITYIFGWNIPAKEDVYGIPPHKSVQIEDMKIDTLKSTDSGVGFLVTVDGLNIFHAGDHANWDDEPTIAYEQEIDYIADAAEQFDIAFFVVTSFSGNRQPSITQGVFYAIDKLNPKILFPMHGNGREYLYQEFAREADSKNVECNIVCAENPGDNWEFSL